MPLGVISPNATTLLRSTQTQRREVGHRRVELLEKILVIVGLLWLMNTFASLLASNANREGGSREAGNLLLQSINLIIYGSGLIFLFRSPPRFLWGLFLRAWPLVVLIALTLVSTFWSDSPDTSLRRSLGLIMTFGFALYIACAFAFEEFISLLLFGLALYILFGILAVAIPGQGITPGGPLAGSWRGFTGIKNDFGRILALSLSYFVVLGVNDIPWWRRLWLPATALTGVLIILSQSKTSLVASFGAIAGAFFLRFLFQPKAGKLLVGPDIRTIAAIATIIAITLSVFVLLPAVAEALGRDMTLSGRTKLWAWAIDLNANRPWFGHGYRSFWIDANTRYFFEFFFWNSVDGESKSDRYAGPANGHNGYLDVWLEMGYVGLVFLTTFLISILIRVRSAFASGNLDCGYAIATTFSFLLVYSITERVILQQSECLWFLTMLFYLYADRQFLLTKSSAHGSA